MKIRNPWLIWLAALLGASLIRLWIGSLRYRYHPLGPSFDPHRPGIKGRFIYAFWHENILVPLYHYGLPEVHVLVSRHADGEIIAEICRRLNFSLIRGSTTRGGVEAMRQMVRVGNTAHVAITPDGPRGPRRHLQAGTIQLASHTGMPIVPFGIGFQKAKRLGSWDRFALPRVGSLATCVTGWPISVPDNLDRDEIEKYRLRVQEELDRLSRIAEDWAERGGEWQELAKAG